MFNQYEIIYVHSENDIEVIGEFSGNSLTVDDALKLCNINMDDYAKEQGWDGYDWNSLSIRLKE